MKTLFKLFVMCVMLLSGGLVYSSSIPVPDDGKWYYVSTGNINTWLKYYYGNANSYTKFSNDSTRKFTLVTTSSGNVTFKEYGGRKLSGDKYGKFISSDTIKGWTMTPTTFNGSSAFTFSGETGSLYGVLNGSISPSTKYISTFSFYEDGLDLALNIKIDSAFEVMSKVKLGTGYYTCSTSSYIRMNNAIKTAKETLGSTDAVAIQNAITTLNNEIFLFNSSINRPFKTSTKSSPIWYEIKNLNVSKGSTMYVNGRGKTVMCTSEINSIPSDGSGTGSTAPNLKYLFRFELQMDTTVKMVSAMQPFDSATIEYLISQTNYPRFSYSRDIIYKQYETEYRNFVLKYKGVNSTYNVNQFSIEGYQYKYNNSWPIVVDKTSLTVSFSNISSNNWYLEEYTGDLNVLYQNRYNELVQLYDSIVDVNGGVKSPYVLGTESGNYSLSAFNALKPAYSALVDAKNKYGIIKDNLDTEFDNMTFAFDNFKASKVPLYNFNGNFNTDKNYTIKLVQPGNTNDGYYLNNPRTDDFNGTDVYKPNATMTATIDPNTSLWKIKPSATTGKYFITSNRRNNEAIDLNAIVRDASVFADNANFQVNLFQNDVDFNKIIVFKNSANNYLYVNNSTDNILINNTTNYSYFLIQEYNPTAVETLFDKQNINVINGTIFLNQSDDITVYNICGQNVINHNLKTGVYIIKTNNQTSKVFVK